VRHLYPVVSSLSLNQPNAPPLHPSAPTVTHDSRAQFAIVRQCVFLTAACVERALRAAPCVRVEFDRTVPCVITQLQYKVELDQYKGQCISGSYRSISVCSKALSLAPEGVVKQPMEMEMEARPFGHPGDHPGQQHQLREEALPGAPTHLPPPRPRGKTGTNQATHRIKPGGRPAAGAHVMLTADSPVATRPILPLCATGCRYRRRCRSRSRTEQRRRYVSRPLCSASARHALAHSPRLPPSPAFPRSAPT
jgi:hypothetical protein